MATSWVDHLKRAGNGLYETVAVGGASQLAGGAQVWAKSWVDNRHWILLLTLINVGITAGNELLCRTAAAPLMSQGEAYSFFVVSDGVTMINRQSLINIFMTLFTSLFGGPIFFFKRRWSRFLFFLGFAAVNSALAQTMVMAIRDGGEEFVVKRLFFDIAYAGTIKYAMFEFWRGPLIQNTRILRISSLRVAQDFYTTFIRVTLLNLFAFRG